MSIHVVTTCEHPEYYIYILGGILRSGICFFFTFLKHYLQKGMTEKEYDDLRKKEKEKTKVGQ